MRTTTAFNRIIAVDGVVVEGVTFTPEGVVMPLYVKLTLSNVRKRHR